MESFVLTCKEKLVEYQKEGQPSMGDEDLSSSQDGLTIQSHLIHHQGSKIKPSGDETERGHRQAILGW